MGTKGAGEAFPRNLRGADLRGANLSGACFIQANFREANLIGADLSGATLVAADLGEADLIGAALRGADLTGANLIGADLSEANFTNASLRWADVSETELGGAIFTHTNLDETDFSYSVIEWTICTDLSLATARGLETIGHMAPSTIGIDTLAQSGGAIPEVFLRGCGVPESFITYAPSLIFKPFEFYSCFISYSSKDQVFAEQFYAELRQRGLGVWFAPEDIRTGDRFHNRIEELIRTYDKVMIILSKRSVASTWVEREVLAAREREDREKRTILFPIRIDNAIEKPTQPCAADSARFAPHRRHDQMEGSRLLQESAQTPAARPSAGA